ncbi:MAG: hypothetical protein V4663_06280 [Bacteroidota bacterium]
MQPTEHKRKNDGELIAHIKQSLKTHEELYQFGAWEKFNAKQQHKKRPIFWMVRLGGVAAILAVCFSLIWVITRTPQAEQVVKTNAPKSQGTTVEPQTLDSKELANEQLAMTDTKESAFVKEAPSSAKQSEVVFSSTPTQVAINTQNSEKAIEATDKVIEASTVSPAVDNSKVIAQVEDKSKPNILDGLTNETLKSGTKQDKLAVSKKQSKWDMGFMLAPSFGNTEELNMGYGLTMSYNFTDRLSLSSGIAYNKMNASKNLPTNVGRSPILLGNTKSLEMINEEVTGIDIPLELKYKINKNVYANLGVSGFAVLSQNRRNTFVEEVVVKRAGSTTANTGGISGSNGSATSSLEDQKGQFANSYIISQRTTEQAAASAIEDVNYIGFYNLSFGYTKKVYKNHALSIEPFVKLPIKMVTQDNLRLIGTGVRLKVGF